MLARLALDLFSFLYPVRRRWVDDPSLLAPLEVGCHLDGYQIELMAGLSRYAGSGRIPRNHWLVASGALIWLLVLAECSAEALARGFWCSSMVLVLRDGFFPLREYARAEVLAFDFWPHFLLARSTMRM